MRVIRTLREMGIRSVAVYSDADRASLHVRMADEAAHIGPVAFAESYLRIDRILDAARKHGAEAIHPGYGFLSENADFAAACEDAGIVFIGPSAESIRAMGSKTAARRLAIAAGAPVVPGTERGVDLRTRGRLRASVRLSGAAQGGGGRRRQGHAARGSRGGPGSRVPRRLERSRARLPQRRSLRREADREAAPYRDPVAGRPARQHGPPGRARMLHAAPASEGDGRVPSPLVARHPEMRQAMGEAAVRAARAAGYYNAGTVEFLVDARRAISTSWR